MSNKISKKTPNAPSSAEDATSGPVFVQLRLPPELAKKLRKEGETAGRKLPAEILYRLQNQGDLKQPEMGRPEALGRLVAWLASRVSEFASPKERNQFSPTQLSMLQAAVWAMTDELGAKDAKLTDDQKVLAQAVGRQLLTELTWADFTAKLGAQNAEELVQLREALGPDFPHRGREHSDEEAAEIGAEIAAEENESGVD